jgi:hypothetical protein
VIVASFSPDGPSKCSGLDVARFDAEGMHSEFGAGFRLLDSMRDGEGLGLAPAERPRTRV